MEFHYTESGHNFNFVNVPGPFVLKYYSSRITEINTDLPEPAHPIKLVYYLTFEIFFWLFCVEVIILTSTLLLNNPICSCSSIVKVNNLVNEKCARAILPGIGQLEIGTLYVFRSNPECSLINLLILNRKISCVDNFYIYFLALRFYLQFGNVYCK